MNAEIRGLTGREFNLIDPLNPASGRVAVSLDAEPVLGANPGHQIKRSTLCVVCVCVCLCVLLCLCCCVVWCVASQAVQHQSSAVGLGDRDDPCAHVRSTLLLYTFCSVDPSMCLSFCSTYLSSDLSICLSIFFSSTYILSRSRDLATS